MMTPIHAGARAALLIALVLTLLSCRAAPRPSAAELRGTAPATSRAAPSGDAAASAPGAENAAAEPAAVTLPDGAFKTLRITEPLGVERRAWPIVVGVPVPQAADVRKLALVGQSGPDAGKLVPHQVLATLAPQYLEAEPDKLPPPEQQVQLVELCFLADLPAGATVSYRLYHGGLEASALPPPVEHADAITYGAEAPGTTIDTGPARFTLHHASGQLLSYAPKHTGFPGALTFLQGAIHWNPDVWAPPLRWGHVSEWGHPDAEPDTAPTVLRGNGPIACRIVRHGKMPWSNAVETSVSYTFFAGQPFVLETSLMEFTADTSVRAVRTNELVFSRGQHTHAAWSDPAAEEGVATMRIFDPDEPTRFFGHRRGLPPDLPWIGLYHQQHRYGLAAINLSRTALSPRSLAGPQDDTAHYYVLDGGLWGTRPGHYEMNFVYFCRSEVARDTIVPKGAIFAERSAFLVFDAGAEGRQLDQMQRWVELLRRPPHVEIK